MSYVTFYRKYRPKNFTEVIGQEHITRTLINALKTNQTSHAYLFTGPRGTGKTSTAKILAKSLNCKNRHRISDDRPRASEKNTPTSDSLTATLNYEPCNNCQSCKDIDNGSSIDVLEIDAASNRGIDEIRSLKERVHFAPVQGSKKVFIIDEVHMLTTEAFNALLKMIEEPPSHAVFILATTEVHKVISTIISRCQRFDFRRILVADVVNRLKEIAQNEKIKVDESSLFIIARQGQGSVRDSIGLLDQLSAFSDKKITPQVLTKALNLTENELLFDITDLILKNDTLGCLNFINKLMDKGFDLRQFTTEMIEHFRSITIVLATAKPAEIINTTEEDLRRLQDQAKRFKIFEALKVIDLLGDTYHQMRFSSDSRILLEIALIKLTKIDADVSIKGLLYRIEELEKKMDINPNNISAKPVKKTLSRQPGSKKDYKQKNETPPVTQTDTKDGFENNKENEFDIERAWPIVMQKIRETSIPLYSLMLECHPLQEDSKLNLMFNSSANFHLKEVDKEPNLTLVKKIVKDVIGTDIDIDCKIGGKEAGTSLTKEKESKSLSADHVISLMRDSFGAEIVEKTTITKEDE